MRINKTKLISLTICGSLFFALNAANSLAADKVGKAVVVKDVIDGALDAGGHRTTTGWVKQGNHRTPSEWVAQDNHRSVGEWFAGVPSRNSKNSKEQSKDKN